MGVLTDDDDDDDDEEDDIVDDNVDANTDASDAIHASTASARTIRTRILLRRISVSK